MSKDKLFIKNMVCRRCITAVENVLNEMGIEFHSIQLGEVAIQSPLNPETKSKLGNELEALGFELIDDKKSKLIEQIKSLIVEIVHMKNEPIRDNLSSLISDKLHHDYNSLSSLFSEVEGITIEKYFIAQKIEKVKELLVYDELTLSQIADQLNYSSVAYLSNQFKKVTGLTPTEFKTGRAIRRKHLDEI
jgi:AraC-like DNA-binding protein